MPSNLRRPIVTALVLGAALSGCAPYVEMATNDGDSTAPEESSTATASDEPAAPDREPLAEGGGGDGGGSPTVGFILDPDGGSAAWLCDLWAQDCPSGEKCNMWANDGGNAWNATKCVPIDPDPDDVGEACTVVGSGVSGIDSCVLGAMCWDVDPDTDLGVCIAYCTGSAANPTCPDPAQHCVGRDFMLCLPSCCPLEQSCNDGQACYPSGDTFECAPDVSGELGEFADPCEYLNVCDPGLFCASPDAVPGCDGSSGCCSYYCDTTVSGCSDVHPAMQCVPWFAEGQAPPGEEHIGACMIPS